MPHDTIDLAHADDPHAIIRELMRRDFISFLIRAFPFISGGAELDVNWHLDAIATSSNGCAVAAPSVCSLPCPRAT